MKKVIEVTEKEVQAAFKVAKSEETKQVLAALFCKEERVTPTLDDYKTIKSYEDACEALEITPILSDDRNKALCVEFQDHYDFRQNMPKHIIALMKLETISRALWGRNWEPKPDADGTKWFYYPYFALWTKDEFNGLNEKQRGALLSATADYGASAGFGFLITDYRSSDADASIGFRLCQETEEKAAYFGQQFIELWAEYLKFNFEVGERL